MVRQPDSSPTYESGVRTKSDERFAAIKAELKMFREGRLVPSQSSLGQHVIDVFKSDPVLATAILSAATQKIGGDQFKWYVDHHLSGKFPDAIDGWIELRLFKRGVESIHTQVKQAADDLTKRLSGVADLENRYSTLIDGLESKFKTDKAFQFWKEKETIHKINAELHMETIRGFSFFSASLFIILTCFIIATEGKSKILDAPLWILLAYTALFFGVVWVGRVLVRLYLSQVTLREDSAERAIMAQTFVALVNEGAAKPDQLNIVLHALFRSATKGPDGDDGSPQLPTEILIKRITGTDKQA